MRNPTPTDRVAPRWWIALSTLAATVLLLAGFGGLWGDRGEGVLRQEATVSGVPVTVIRPDSGNPAPGVVVAHGFAGSAVLMDGLGTALARAGHTVALLDFAGHGRNPAGLPATGAASGRDELAAQVAAVADWLAAQEFTTTEPIGLVGHSMGAGAVVAAGVADPAGYRATVALSLPSADALPRGEPAVPRNLLLLWGSAEQARFGEAALAGLRAGYPAGTPGALYGNPADGTARAAREVPGAEHLSILWRTDTAQWTADWLTEPGSTGLPVALAPRMLFVAGALLGGLLALVPLSSLLLGNRRPQLDAAVPARRAVPAMLVAAIAASLVAAAAAPLTEGVPLAVGGHLAWWFGGGAVALLLLGRLLGTDPVKPAVVDWIGAAALALWLTAILAASGRLSWAPAALVGVRPWLFVLFVIVFLAWFAGDEVLVRRASRRRRAVLLAVSRIILVAALLGGVFLLGAPGFLLLLLPLMVPLLVLLAAAAWIVGGRTAATPAGALVQAVPLALLVATTFPLLAP